jgi:hypothetical protein
VPEEVVERHTGDFRGQSFELLRRETALARVALAGQPHEIIQ